jgi:hypothetical protein
MATGYIYVLKNELAPIYKIGKAAEHRIKQRLKELDVGTKNQLIGYWRVWGYSRTEQDLHRILKKYRIPQSEYFALPDDELSRLIENLKEAEFDGYEVGSDGTDFGYIRITPYPTHVTLEDSDGECVAIDESILLEVIEKLTSVKDDRFFYPNSLITNGCQI